MEQRENYLNALLDIMNEKKELQKAIAELMYHMLTASFEWRSDIELNAKFEKCAEVLKKSGHLKDIKILES